MPGKPLPKGQRKARIIPVRVDENQFQEFSKAARSEGLSLSAWLRRLALQALRRNKESE
jgi:hypothetical protein